MDVSRDQLILCCETAEVQWGAGHPLLPRIIELYNNRIIYWFEESCNSSLKTLREKVFLHDCRMIDIGTVGAMEALAVFLQDHTYVEEVDWPGNKLELMFEPPHPPAEDPFASFSCTCPERVESGMTPFCNPFRLPLQEGANSFREKEAALMSPNHTVPMSTLEENTEHEILYELLSPSGSREEAKKGRRWNKAQARSHKVNSPVASSFWKEFLRGDYLALLYVPKKEV